MHSDNKRDIQISTWMDVPQSQAPWHLIYSRNAPVVFTYFIHFLLVNGKIPSESHFAYCHGLYNLVFLWAGFSITLMWWQFYHFISTSVFWSLFSDSLLWPDCTECSRGWLYPLATVLIVWPFLTPSVTPCVGYSCSIYLITSCVGDPVWTLTVANLCSYIIYFRLPSRGKHLS